MARNATPIAGTFQLMGEIVGLAKSGKNLKIQSIDTFENVIVPHGLGLKEGDELLGTATLATVTYDTDADDKPLATPIVRTEMIKFLSLAAKDRFNKLSNSIEFENAFAQAKKAAVTKMVFTPEMFFSPVSSVEVTAAQATI